MSENLIEAFLFPIPNLDYTTSTGKRKLRSIIAMKKIAPYYKLYLSPESSKRKIISHYTLNTEDANLSSKRRNIVKTNYRVIEKIPNIAGNMLFIYATQASHRKM